MNERSISEQQSVRDSTDETLNQNDDVIIGDGTRSNLQQQTRRETTSGDIETTDRRNAVRDNDAAGFLPDDRMDEFRERWNDVQAAFVDDPRSAVQRAQQLVDDLVKELTDVFSGERSRLEGQWSGGGQADTEALRVALQRYREFFNRLLGT
jgi:hypothetical protein